MSIGFKGKVAEAVNASKYTYVQVDTGEKKIWAAAPAFEVKVGGEVVVPPGLPMVNHQSKTLDRTSPLVYFVPSVIVVGAASSPAQQPKTPHPMAAMPPMGKGITQLPHGHPCGAWHKKPVVAPADMDFSGIKKPDGGKTVAEIYAERAALTGKEVKVRGKVVKYNEHIMGENWLHLQDGTGSGGTNDLTVTTQATAKVGDTILVSGALSVDKDFGFGYKYEVLVEDAKVTVE